MELIKTIVRIKVPGEEITVHVITVEDEFKGEDQKESLEIIRECSAAVGINFTWEFDESGHIHARHIVTDHGWKISLDRGLDVFQKYEMNDSLSFANRLQEERRCKAFEVTFIKMDE